MDHESESSVVLEDGEPPNCRVKLLCSFGGKIMPRPSDGKLRYAGGETRIVSFSKDISYANLMTKLMAMCDHTVVLKYQMPDEDLDALVSVCNDEDVEHMMEEYQRVKLNPENYRLRTFLFPALFSTSSSNNSGDSNNTGLETMEDLDILDALRDSYIQAINGAELNRMCFCESAVTFPGGNISEASVSTFQRQDIIYSSGQMHDEASHLCHLCCGMVSYHIQPACIWWQCHSCVHCQGQALKTPSPSTDSEGQQNSLVGPLVPTGCRMSHSRESTCIMGFPGGIPVGRQDDNAQVEKTALVLSKSINLSKAVEVTEVNKFDKVCDDEAQQEDSRSGDKDNVASSDPFENEAISRGLQTIKNDHLEEIRELGSGTFGTVFYGKWRGSEVAIKRIKPCYFEKLPSEKVRLIRDFWKEACTLAQLHHPNIVALYGVVPDGPDGTLATVTEYMVNGSLKQVLRRKDRTIDRRKRLLIAMDAAIGMEYLHEKKIVHFDLKCDNLLVNMKDPQRPICKVGDFGLSKVKHQTMVSGGVRGTLPWMAPELLDSSSKVSDKVDVFSFGIVMWELLTGEEPYANMHYGTIIGGIVQNNLRPTIPEWCDPLWKSLMERCWAACPADRPSFSEVASELRAMTVAPLQTRGQSPAQASCS